jgi:hypothetical protein
MMKKFFLYLLLVVVPVTGCTIMTHEEMVAYQKRKAPETDDLEKIDADSLVEDDPKTVNSNVDGKLITTKHGQLSIVGDLYDMQLQFNGQNLYESNASLRLAFEKQFLIGGHKVVLVSEGPWGTACNALYFFVTLKATNNVELSPQFGTCSDLIDISQEIDRLIITMPTTDLETGDKRTQYIYANGIVSENGKALMSKNTP